MRSLMRLSLFLGVAAWSLPCQAFGVKGGGEHPKSIEGAINAWTGGNARIDSICTDGLNSWIAVVDNQLRSDGPLPNQMRDYLEGLISAGPPPRSICFHPDGWVVVKADGGIKWEGLPVPQAVSEHIDGALGNGAALLSVSYTKRAWVVVTDRSVNFGGEIPPDMRNQIQQLRQNNVPIRSASVAPNGSWLVNFK